jgi:hypothetical protein
MPAVDEIATDRTFLGSMDGGRTAARQGDSLDDRAMKRLATTPVTEHELNPCRSGPLASVGMTRAQVHPCVLKIGVVVEHLP